MSRTIRAALAMAGSLAALAGGATTAHAAGTSPSADRVQTARDAASGRGDVVQLQAAHSGKCLGIGDPKTDNGTGALQWTCNDGTPQQWRAIPTVGSSYVLRNERSGKCLEVENSGTQAGARVQQWDCSGGGPQLRWQMLLIDPAKGLYQLRPAHTKDRCLDIDHAQQGDGVRAQQWYCNQTDAQLWRIQPVK
ncbi:hypothetical protein SSP35_02_03060 [Streptomyces sp. NBRC 110611]|uniref:RICIN domain-containing protein n=1 Tax=Streptomyces sp. NBRC 110611 TaxID=1621259 RepID=UPI0008310931|nr:RICIN domain-containing protein [Streptomyces sp. NBRC 110611]GAU65937.1 hypothetical protein SSP35_02_03060 [Streptomyces sp. NBRC 110611]